MKRLQRLLKDFSKMAKKIDVQQKKLLRVIEIYEWYVSEKEDETIY